MTSELLNEFMLEHAYFNIDNIDFGETLSFQQLINEYHVDSSRHNLSQSSRGKLTDRCRIKREFILNTIKAHDYYLQANYKPIIFLYLRI